MRRHAHRGGTEVVGGGGGFFHQRGIGLGVAVKLMHGFANLANAQALLTRTVGHFVKQVFHVRRVFHNLVHVFASLAHDVCAARHLVGAGGDEGFDFFGSGRTAPRQRPHFGGHHGKATALLTGARGFYRGIERQDVGLEGNAVNHANDVADFLRRGLDAPHGGRHVLHHRTALAGGVGVATGNVRGLAGRLSRHGHGGVGLLQRGRRLLQCRCGRLGARRQVLRAGGNFHTGGDHCVAGLLHLGNGLRQRQLHVGKLFEHAGDFIPAMQLNGGTQVAHGDVDQVAAQCRKALREGVVKPHAQVSAQQQKQRRQRQRQPHAALHIGLALSQHGVEHLQVGLNLFELALQSVVGQAHKGGGVARHLGGTHWHAGAHVLQQRASGHKGATGQLLAIHRRHRLHFVKRQLGLRGVALKLRQQALQPRGIGRGDAARLECGAHQPTHFNRVLNHVGRFLQHGAGQIVAGQLRRK